MARNRMINVEFWDDEKLATIPRDARLLFIGLWNYSDDYGVVKGHSVWLKSKIFPYDNIDIETFNGWLQHLKNIHSIQPFTVHNEQYYSICNFGKYQVINKPSKRRNPAPPKDFTPGTLPEHYGSTTGHVPDEVKLSEVKENISKAQNDPVVGQTSFAIPLKDGSDFPITKSTLAELKTAYPNQDVEQTLREIRMWNIANETRRKTRTGIMRHINAWLEGNHNKGKNMINGGGNKSTMAAPQYEVLN